ncbi:MAG: hypothetical protein PHN84_03360 [Desulfuromonadaceae bacterium]|nr:hypothetical protein [Desulfuromonadaceae bacterium]MDD2854222.1 hypothetical protein [Desulfuromonadaceae bacterium]
MATKLHLIGIAAPSPTTGADVLKGAPLSPAEVDQNFANLRAAVDKIIGEAASQAEEDALFAAGYRFVLRTDILSASLNPAPTATIVFTDII